MSFSVIVSIIIIIVAVSAAAAFVLRDNEGRIKPALAVLSLVLAGFDMQAYNGATHAPSILLALLGIGVVIALTAVLLLVSHPSSKGAPVKPKKAKGRGHRQARRT